MPHNKLLQQIWRLVLNTICGNGTMRCYLISVDFSCSVAKQLNRTLYVFINRLIDRQYDSIKNILELKNTNVEGLNDKWFNL